MWHDFRICDFDNAIICGKNMQYAGFGEICGHI